jgi:cytochrome oxidase Cu insertion factor (SCO1/SenC/PrrC family)
MPHGGSPDDMLQLSVHSLPQPGGGLPQRTRSGRWKMLLVMVICAAPVVASYFTYYVIRPQGRTNHGTLIQPTRAMPALADLPLQTLDGQPVDPASLKQQWLFIAVGGGACDAVCEQQLYLQRQIRESLGKEKERVDRVWLINDAQAMRPDLKKAMEGATVLRVPPGALARWLAPEEGHALAEHWYLVDPMGQWMMRFPVKAEPRLVLKDLNKLMRAAAGWDEAGRP